MSKADLEKLKKKWYAKLKKLGFNDIEQDEDNLKSWDSQRFLINNRHYGNRAANHQSRADYYYYAGHFLNNHKFEKEIHKVIWEEHTNGVSVRDISEKLNKDRAYDVSHETVRSIIKHYREIMKKQL